MVQPKCSNHRTRVPSPAFPSDPRIRLPQPNKSRWEPIGTSRPPGVWRITKCDCADACRGGTTYIGLRLWRDARWDLP